MSHSHVSTKTKRKLAAFSCASESEDETTSTSTCSTSLLLDNSNHQEEVETVDLSFDEECQPAATSTQESMKKKKCDDKISAMWNLPYARKSEAHRVRTNAVALYLLEEGQPMYTVERPAFKKLLKVFDRRYDLPSRTQFREKIVQDIYGEVYSRVKQELEGVTDFAVTTDFWSSRANDAYMSFTVHFITSFELKCKSLQVMNVPQDHTADTIKDELMRALEDWDLQSCGVTAITTDNARNNVRAIQDLGWLRFQCFGHRLNLAVRSSLTSQDHVIKPAMRVVKRIINHFSHSHKKKRELRKAQNELGIPNHNLIKECETRWGSMFLSIQRFIEQEPAIRKVLSTDRNHTHLLPTGEQMNVLEATVEGLKPVSDLTDCLSGDTDVTISNVLPTLMVINKRLTKETDVALTNTLRRKINEYIQEKYNDLCTQDFLKVCSFLDPRFKMDYSDETAVSRVTNEARALSSSAGCSTGSARCQSPKKKVKASGITAILAELKENESDEATNAAPDGDQAMQEVQLYRSLSPEPLSTDILEWWKSHQSTFPSLARVAVKYLCVPATSVSSERQFSAAGNIVSAKRSSLQPYSVNQLCFIQANLKQTNLFDQLL